jgi:ATP-dependent DNA ligase
MVLDGELYLHGESCQHITSLVKSACLATSKSYKKGSLDLIYHVYDVPSCERIWADRKKCLESIKLFMVDKNVSNVAVVRTREARSESEMQDIHDFYVEEGYEGVIVRARNHEYLWGFRSDGLLKYKCFEDGEFTVIDAKEGVGKMVGHVVWICQNDINDKTFDCTPKVSMDERKRFYQERSSYIGKKLTVRYFGRTDADKPRFPVGIVFRSKKDM